MIEKKKLPIGEEFFRNIRTKGFYYVDKTEFIGELLRTRGSVKIMGIGEVPENYTRCQIPTDLY